MQKEWATIIIGYPIITKLIHGQAVVLDFYGVTLLPDDELMNEHLRITGKNMSEKKSNRG